MRKLVLQILVSSLFLGYVAYSVDWHQMAGAFYELNAVYFGLSTSAAVLGPVVVAAKYRILIAQSALDTPFRRLVVINFISRFYALFLPSAAGPEAVRWYKLTKDRPGKASFLAVTIFERLHFVAILLLCGAIPIFLSDDGAVSDLGGRVFVWIIVVGVAILSGLGYFISPSVRGKARAVAFQVLAIPDDSRLGRLLQELQLPRMSGRIVAGSIAWACAWQFAFVIRMALLFKASAIPLPIWDIAWIASTVLLLQSLPISVAGLGVREGAYAFLFSLVGVSDEAGVVVGLLFFVQMLFVSALGWAVQVFDIDRIGYAT